MFNFVFWFLNITDLLRFLLIVLLIILVIRILNRIIFSSFVYTNDRTRSESQQTRKEGSVTLEKNGKSEKLISNDEGEYVDYEEVK